MSTIFVVDDEDNIRLLISRYLQNEGFTVEAFTSTEELFHRLKSGYPDMFILDIMLPGQDGLEFCRDIREHSNIPVIFISARRKALDRIMGLEIGGDDYLPKPFSPRELVARVRSVFRRTLSPPDPQNYLQAGNLKLILGDRLLLINEQELNVTTKEFELLSLLVQHPQRTFNRQELLDRVWGYDYDGSERAVDDLIKRLRKKLKENGSETNIHTIWGYGYRLNGQVKKHIN
ncbi:MAG: response regulator transcription factor [Syntrophomonadaceae bacterium]|nr:response regulator transcription factor [Syntrophomonadaceae bacterium]MDD3024316.1 response regulator transcription factor [Syntrophomonadaceae bacterium]